MPWRLPTESAFGALRHTLLGPLLAVATGLAACSGMPSNPFEDLFGKPPTSEPTPAPSTALGTGSVKVGLILPLSAGGNAGAAGLSLKNAAELALAERDGQKIQLLVKDDGGNAQGAQRAVQQALDEGAEIILGPLFGHSVGSASALTRARGVPLIAFSTNVDVAASGVYLLSFLPESDVRRIIEYAIARGKRSFAALVPDNAYGTVVEAAFKETVGRKSGRVVALERYPLDAAKLPDAVKPVAQAASRVDAILIADGGDMVPAVVKALVAGGANLKRVQLLGTSLWDDPRIFADTALHGGWYPLPDPTGFRNFSNRYRSRFGQDPARTASLAYDAVTLVIALVKTQGAQRFSREVLTSSAGFAGVDGIFRFRADGTNERGLAVMRVAPGGGQPVSPAPRAFAAAG